MTSSPPETKWVDPDAVPRAVLSYRFSSDLPEAVDLDAHAHAKSQILLVQSGALSCETSRGLWVVPPRSALWLPAGIHHAVRMAGRLDGYNVFLSPELAESLPAGCCALAVTPLLREIVARMATLPLLHDEAGPAAHLIAVMRDELATASVEDLHLPMPSHARLRQAVDRMVARPSEREMVADCAARAGLSERTLGRIMMRETGMSFGRWRQQLNVVTAIGRLADGASIQQVAADLGYESLPSFVAMFRKVVGTPPGRYMSERCPTERCDG